MLLFVIYYTWLLHTTTQLLGVVRHHVLVVTIPRHKFMVDQLTDTSPSFSMPVICYSWNWGTRPTIEWGHPKQNVWTHNNSRLESRGDRLQANCCSSVIVLVLVVVSSLSSSSYMINSWLHYTPANLCLLLFAHERPFVGLCLLLVACWTAGDYVYRVLCH